MYMTTKNQKQIFYVNETEIFAFYKSDALQKKKKKKYNKLCLIQILVNLYMYWKRKMRVENFNVSMCINASILLSGVIVRNF